MAYQLPALSDIQELLYNSSAIQNTLTFDFVIDGVLTSPTSATITIYSPQGNVLVNAAAMTNTTGKLSYLVDTTTTASWPKRQGYKASLAILYSSQTYVRTFVVDVVANQLYPVLHDSHLLEHDPGMASYLPSSDTTFAKWIVAAWREIRTLIRRNGKRPALLLDPQALLMAHKYLALSMFYSYCSYSDSGDRWKELSDTAMKYYKEEITDALAFAQYDLDEDGKTNGAEPINISQVSFRR